MNIQHYLEQNILVFDGAMGTYVNQKYPVAEKSGCELWNGYHESRIAKIHREYLEAGAVAVKTNTFALNPYSMPIPIGEMEQLIRKGYEIAYDAVVEFEREKGILKAQEEEPKEHFVFADIGPMGVGEDQDIVGGYRTVVDTFLQCGAKYFLFETLDSDQGLEEISSYIKRSQPDSFILVSFGVSPEGFTRGGCYGRRLFEQLQQIETIDAIGFNCISGPKHLLEMVKKFDLRECTKYVSIMPNAGYPTVVSQRMVYDNNPAYFASAIGEIAAQGVSILGGCCGTSPEYIEKIVDVLKEKKVKVRIPAKSVDGKELEATEDTSGANLARTNPKNSFAAKLERGEKVIVVELDPPVTPEVDVFMEGAARFQRAGVDAIDIADCPIARARIDSSILASKVSRELQMTAIPHLTCRDRNINATKALLLGLNVEGVNNVLTVTGDPVPVAERQEIKTVFSYNSAVLAKHINTFNETTFNKNPFMVCGALNVNAVNFDSQISHALKKIENGVSVLFTQPVMTKEGLENLKRARRELPVKILGGMIPVVSYRNACFMEHEIAGIRVDERIIQMYQGKNREAGEELAVRIVSRIAEEIRDYVDGYYLITPFQRISLMEKIIGTIRK